MEWTHNQEQEMQDHEAELRFWGASQEEIEYETARFYPQAEHPSVCMCDACDPYSNEEVSLISQYWSHKLSGDVYAVQIDHAGWVYSACGPLDNREATVQNLNSWNFNNDPALADDLDVNQGDYFVRE